MQGFLKIIAILAIIGIVLISILFVLDAVTSIEVKDILQKVLAIEMVSSSQTSIYNVLESFMARHRVLILFIYTFTIVWVAFFASKVIGEITYGTEAMGKLYSLIGSLPLIGILAFRRDFIEQVGAVVWKKFSLRNNWSYSPTLDLSKESAVLLKQGNSGRSAKYELRKI